MLRTIGVSSIDELISLTIPASIRSNTTTQKEVHEGMRGFLSEKKATDQLRLIASENIPGKSFIGQGFVPSDVPTVLKRLVLENPGWYTTYTPYQVQEKHQVLLTPVFFTFGVTALSKQQAEISQGRLEALLVYQVCNRYACLCPTSSFCN